MATRVAESITSLQESGRTFESFCIVSSFAKPTCVTLRQCAKHVREWTISFITALASVPRSLEEPELSHRCNVEGTFNVLEAARAAHVKRFIYAASSSAYGDQPILPCKETMRPMPISPYAVQKLTGEYYASSYWQVYGLETVSMRYFNVFRPRQSADSPYTA